MSIGKKLYIILKIMEKKLIVNVPDGYIVDRNALGSLGLTHAEVAGGHVISNAKGETLAAWGQPGRFGIMINTTSAVEAHAVVCYIENSRSSSSGVK